MERIKREIDEGINFNYIPELSFFSHNVVILHVYVVVFLCQQVRHLKRGLSSLTGPKAPKGCNIVKVN